MGSLTPLFWTSVGVYPGLQSLPSVLRRLYAKFNEVKKGFYSSLHFKTLRHIKFYQVQNLLRTKTKNNHNVISQKKEIVAERHFVKNN